LLYFFEGYSLDLSRRELRRGAELIAVEPQVFDVLAYLIENRERVVSRGDLIASVWGGRIVSESALNTRINAVRHAIGDSGAAQHLIKTLPRKGVRFVAAVRQEAKLADAAGVDIPLPHAEPESPPRNTPAAAERRRLTISSCELVLGANGHGSHIDPEDLRDLLGTYRRCVAETAAPFNGLVDRGLDNIVRVCFGYPQAHEDDAEQAVRAGLELCTAFTRREPRGTFRLQVRVGIATGQVVIGGGDGDQHERALVGEPPSIAACLHNAAHPDAVLVDRATRELIGGLFDCREVEPIHFPASVAPLRAWQVIGASAVESRFEALHPVGLAAMVGRDEELELLGRRWAQAQSGEGRLVFICGEPGIGKSRLVAALEERLSAQPHGRLRYFCALHFQNSALRPIISHIERAARFGIRDTPTTKLEKLQATFDGSSRAAGDLAILADLLGLATGGLYPALELSPERKREKTFEVLLGSVEDLARRQPVLMIFEDVQWIDPTSLELLDRLVARLRQLPILLVATARPEFAASWTGLARTTTIMLSRLAPREGITLVQRIEGDASLRKELVDDIIERSDGVPLFIEEMTKAVLEAEREGTAKRVVAAAPPRALAVPASLHASLLARLDRLGPAREVAQIGAAIGREFSHALLTAVVHKPEPELSSSLDRLVAAGLLFRRGVPPHATYLFKHALVQDAAYGTLLREPRRGLHARIAEILETQFAEIAESQPELLARHCTEAALIEKAAGLWAKAGQRSFARSALVEAIEQLMHALRQVAALPTAPARRREEIELQVALINPLMHVKGYAAAETKAAVERARLLIEQAEALGEHPEDPLLLFSVLYGFWAAKYVAFDGDLCRDLARQFLAVAEKQGAIIPLMVANRMMGTSLLFTGETAQAQEHLDRAIALYDRTEHRALARFGQDVRVSTLSFRSLALWLLGYPDAALADSEQALTYAREIGQSVALMYALTMTSWIHIHCRDYATADTRAAELCSLAGEKDAALWNAFRLLSQGCVLVLTGNALTAVQILASGLTALRATGATFWAPLSLSYLARAHAELGQFADAQRCIGEAMTAVETTDERWWESEVYRVAGEIALQSSEPDAAKAESYFQQAITVARKQQAKSLELRAVMSMARLWRDQGKRDEARDLLAPVYGWFTEGFDTLDLRDAKALLGEMHA
jgi:predicted ATPase/DNA-binding winged helix-turn-helix (wHTH) protein